jgi:hypothetical protein
MLEGVLSDLIKFGEQIIQMIQQLNSWLLQNFGGILLLIAALAAIAAWRKASKEQENQNAMRDLANAIVKIQNKELREKA